MAQTHAFDFLKENELVIPPMCAVIGEDRFLKRLTLARIRQELTEDGDAAEFGPKTPWRDVSDELLTLSLFGDGPRIVIIQDADDFVKTNRPQLEALTKEPKLSGCLILDLKTLPTNTRLFKGLADSGQIVECNPPQTKRGKTAYVDEVRLCDWIRDWGQATHGVDVKRGADEELLGLSGPELGLIDQELAKLALFCEPGAEVTVELVRQVVGGWRAKTTWDLLDAALDGNAADALLQLERLLQFGEAPQMILGGLLWSLRRFANAAQIIMEAESAGTRMALPLALEQAGFRKWPKGAMQRAEKQIRQLGRHRAGDLYERLLKLDLAMKSTHAAPARSRWALEQFLLSLSKQANVA